MRYFKDKYQSQTGASLAIALLFFLMCTVVASSILVAASTSIGTYNSDKEYQQKTLALSSALQTVCEGITQSEYYGQYSYTKTGSEGVSLVEVWNNTSSQMNVAVPKESQSFSVRQLPGTYKKIDGTTAGEPMFKGLIQANLEYFFNQQLEVDVKNRFQAIKDAAKNNASMTSSFTPTIDSLDTTPGTINDVLAQDMPADSMAIPSAEPYELMLDVTIPADKAEELSALDGYKVKITFSFPNAQSNGYGIQIVAELMMPDDTHPGEHVADPLVATLLADLVPAPDAQIPSFDSTVYDGSSTTNFMCGPMRWSVNYIEQNV